MVLLRISRQNTGWVSLMNDTTSTNTSGTLLQRLGWLVLIWVCSIASLGAVAGLMRLLMGFAGMTPSA
ncbi:DUF2474 domain-containing protein [Paenalcaligenes sp. Me52]|uniref:DUF2474 domain-containing protein n=1 Tax=Paenalcaligenes sp. Me52 TaxID=3392038 RepID=UPI003D290493